MRNHSENCFCRLCGKRAQRDVAAERRAEEDMTPLQRLELRRVLRDAVHEYIDRGGQVTRVLPSPRPFMPTVRFSRANGAYTNNFLGVDMDAF